MRPEIVLASSSPYRRMLLDRLGLPYICQSPYIDESAQENESAQMLSRRLAEQKANALASRFSAHWIIGSDQVAERDSTLLGKPGSEANACSQLLASSSKEVCFHTSVTLLDTSTGHFDTETDLTKVKFRKLTENEVAHYVSVEKPLDCAGSFKVEGLGITLFERIDSSDPTALIGLPLILLNTLLRRRGYNLLDSTGKEALQTCN